MWHTLAVALLALMGQMCTALRELPTPITEAGGPELARGFPVEVSAVVVCLSCLPTTSDVNQPFDQESRFSNGCLNSELAVWTEGLPLAEALDFPFGLELRWNSDLRVLGVLTGEGTVAAATAVTALGLDPRFDLRKSLWLVSGTAGIDPLFGTPGDAVWADLLVDGDIMKELDLRDVPDGWQVGKVPWSKSQPYQEPAEKLAAGEPAVWRLKPVLVDYALKLTGGGAIQLPDSEAAQRMRSEYDAARFPQATGTPRVRRGCSLTGNRFWGGVHAAAWARNWTAYYNQGARCFGVSAMEDTGVAQALAKLHCAGRADAERLLVLRTASDLVMPARAGESDYDAIFGAQGSSDYLVGLPLSLNASFAVGSRLVHQAADPASAIHEVLAADTERPRLCKQ